MDVLETKKCGRLMKSIPTSDTVVSGVKNTLSRDDDNIISQNHKKSIPKVENRKVSQKPPLTVTHQLKKRPFKRLKKDGRLSSFVSSQDPPQLCRCPTL
jgi:hypothetical protein